MLRLDWRRGAFLSYIYPGAFGRLVGFWSACVLATFAYTGVEMIGIAAHEMERQRETIPHAVRRVSHRIVFYYVGAVFVLGLNVSVQDKLLQQSALTGDASGFFLMVQRAGLMKLPSVINTGAFITVLSITNSCLYLTVLPLNFRLMDYRAALYMHFQESDKHQRYFRKNFG